MTQAVLLDLGNVVVEIDFRRVFRYWSEQSGVASEVLLDRWSLDDAYKSQEVGDIDFTTYIASLEQTLEIEMSLAHWETGWNRVFVSPFPRVQERLNTLRSKVPLFAFTNTNNTHERYWSRRFPDALVHFEKIYVSSHIGMRKPDVSSYQFVADDMGVAPADILFVDDNRENVDGATDAGFRAAWVRSEEDILNVLDQLLASL